MDYDFFHKRQVLKKVADAFQVVHDTYSTGGSISVACSLPPRSGKSYLTSLFAAFMLGRFPSESVMRNTCTAHLYQKFSIDTRDLVKSGKFHAIFGEAQLHPSRQQIDGWSLKDAKQVSYFGSGVGGSIIGFGASMLAITDDLFNNFEDAASETINEKTWRWKEGTHDSRIERNCCKIDIGTRWSKRDVIGRMEAAGEYDIIVRIPALIDGKTFSEDVHTTEYYLKLEKTIDKMIWKSEYMQEPIEAEGLLFPPDELNYFTLDEINGKDPEGVIASCDTADRGNDFFSAPFARIFKDRYFITDVVFTQEPVEVTEAALSQKIIDTKCEMIRIESNAGGRIFANNIKKLIKGKSKCEVKPRATTSNKETRIIMKSGFIKEHFWFRNDYEKGSDYDKFMQQITGYLRLATNQKDDAPDSVTMLAEFIEHIGILRKPSRKLSKRQLGVR